MTLREEMAFGKHQGVMLEDVIEEDPDYVEWCIKNIDWFYDNLEEDVLERLREKDII
jgi:uncharacterized protein (DUF3820 family)